MAFLFNNSAKQAQQQIAAVQQAFPSARLVKERSEITIPFERVGQNFTLRVVLSPRFPAERPTLHVFGSSTRFPHEWVNDRNEVVGHPWLLHWRSENSLVNLIRDVLARFQQHAAPAAVVAAAAVVMPPPPPTYNTAVASPARDDRASESAMPMEIPTRFSELDTMTLEQLQRLQKDEIAFNAFFEGIESVRTTRGIQEQLLQQNADIAHSNLAHQEELEALHAEVQALRSTLQDTVSRFDAQVEKHMSKEATTDAAVIAQVSEAATNAEDASEEVTSKFMDGEIEIKPFLTEFIARRKEYHSWTSKVDHVRT